MSTLDCKKIEFLSMMKLRATRLLRITTVVAAAAASGQASLAGPIQDIMKQAMPILPPYCKVRLEQRDGQPEWEYWKNKLGPGFVDIHHHCFGLAQVFVSRTAMDKARRDELLRGAMIDFSYVIGRNKPSTLTILNEVYTERGKLYIGMNDFVKAKADFDRASDISRGAYR